MSKALRIIRWRERHETGKTREYKTLSWIADPTDHDSIGFRRIMKLGRQGAEIYGAYKVIAQSAAKCPMRGILAKGEDPVTPEEIAMLTGIHVASVRLAFKALIVGSEMFPIDPKTGERLSPDWLDWVELPYTWPADDERPEEGPKKSFTTAPPRTQQGRDESATKDSTRPLSYITQDKTVAAGQNPGLAAPNPAAAAEASLGEKEKEIADPSPVMRSLIAAKIGEPTRSELAAHPKITARLILEAASKAKQRGASTSQIILDIRAELDAAALIADANLAPLPLPSAVAAAEATEAALEGERKAQREIIESLPAEAVKALHAEVVDLVPGDPKIRIATKTRWRTENPLTCSGLRAEICKLAQVRGLMNREAPA